LPGRTRIRLADARGDRAYFALLRRQLSELPGVESVRANFRTGTVLLEHSSPLLQVAETARGAGLFELEAECTPQTMVGIFDWVESLLGGSIPDLRQQRQIVAAVLMTMALIQFRRGQVFGPATAYLWNMLDLLYFRQPEVVADAQA
jgi:hypothetical protein